MSYIGFNRPFLRTAARQADVYGGDVGKCLMRIRACRAMPTSVGSVCTNAGFGLIELLVAVVIIAIGVLGMSTLATSMIRGNLSARLNDEATQLAREKVEDIYHDGYKATPTGSTTEMLLNLYKQPAISFTRQTTVASGPLANTRTVTVTMTWTDGAVRNTTFATEIVQ